MKVFRFFVLGLVVVVFGLGSVIVIAAQTKSEKGKVSGKEVLAVVGKEKITLSEFNELIAGLPPRYQNVVRNNKEKFLDDLVNLKLLYFEALKRKLDRNEDIRKRIADMREQILADEILIKEVKEKVSVSEEDLKQYYQSRKDEFQEPEKIRVRQILVDTKEQAEEVAGLISKGSDFATLAKERSKGPSGKKGGDLGFFSRGRMVPEFEKAAFQLKLGEVSGIVKTRFGYHIIKLEEKEPAELKDYSVVKNSIKQKLITQKSNERREVFIQELRDKSKIIIYKELLGK